MEVNVEDNCWLNNNIIDSALNYRFYLKDIVTEDEISINIRSEIVNFFKATLTLEKQNANVILETSQEIDSGFIVRKEDKYWIITAKDNQMLLYGLYYFVINNYLGELRNLNVEKPSNNIRMIDHWDNFDGTIERGYAGKSFFFIDNQFSNNFGRIKRYARLLASVGINAIAINNVNVHKMETFLISDKLLNNVKQLVDVFAAFGIKVFLSINFASPIRIGGLNTADPLSPEVAAWWKKRAKAIYELIPNFGGFLVKADSEGEPGPFAYGRDHADGANMLASAVAPFGGIIIWRAFVYNSQQDWRDRSIDRAKAAYDNFITLDGKFANNVALQIKFGPIDFQTREPIQPLFGSLQHTNQLIEFQITQEYTGHQIDLNYLLPQWERVLNFDLHIHGDETKLKDIPLANSVNPQLTGVAAVSNVGSDENWTGNKLAQANLYGFGRLAWCNELTAQQVLNEWVNLTFEDEDARTKIYHIMITSNTTYENYTAPLGVGFMVVPHVHYGPAVDGYEFDRWGTYHFADRNGVGVDRTLATGTGYTQQYSDAVCSMYDNLATCPDNLLLFFHHVDYRHVLHNGQTVIQYIYDTHFAGYDMVCEYLKEWQTLEDKVPNHFYRNVLDRLKMQLKNAKEWRDQINTFFYRMSGIDDDKGRTIYR